jgi:hypothetical protein
LCGTVKKPIGGDGHGAPQAEEEFRGLPARFENGGLGKVQKLEGHPRRTRRERLSVQFSKSIAL